MAWNPANKSWFEKKGYIFTKWKDTFEVNVEDLMPQSDATLEAICDTCKIPITRRYNQVSGKLNEETYCTSCNATMIGRSRRLEYEDVKRFIEIESNSGCKLLSKEYIGNNKNLEIQCRCGSIFKTTYQNFSNKSKRQCNDCGLEIKIKKLSKTNESYIKELKFKVGDEYTALEKYKDSTTKISTKHNLCGYVWDVLPSNILSGYGCPFCYGNVKKTTEEYKYEIHQLVGDEYSVAGEYEGAHTHIKMRHNICGHEWMVSPSSILGGSRCPKCAMSRGENSIYTLLKKWNIAFETEYRVDECRNKNPLPFDFAVFDSSGNIAFFIEYDGIQHFEEVAFGGIDIHRQKNLLKYTQHNDNIKKEYCKNSNVSLLTIPYWQFDNIESILKEWLIKYSLISVGNNRNNESEVV